jgi:hypothetical protein
MARQHYIRPQGVQDTAITVRLGAQGVNYSENDAGKFVKLAAESQYDLCAVGNEIEAVITSVEPATQNGFSIGGVICEGILDVTFDGLQATPGTGTIAVGDYVVTGTPVARNTAMTVYPKVCKATAAATGIVYKWRVVSLGTAGTGAVGTSGVIMEVC